MADPTRVVICGSLQFPDRIAAAVEAERAAGRDVIAWPGTRWVRPTAEQMAQLWREFIEAADEVVIVRKPDGTIGKSTQDERDYALSKGKLVRWFPYWDKLADPFGTTCIDCGEAINDARPYVATTEGDLMHEGCGDEAEPPHDPLHRGGRAGLDDEEFEQFHALITEGREPQPRPAADTGMSVDEAVPPADGSKERLQYELRLAWARVDEQRQELDRLEAMEQRARVIADGTAPLLSSARTAALHILGEVDRG